eukprot:jgi/Astpho2/7683/fgenesh1_pg.00115_%23_75_t
MTSDGHVLDVDIVLNEMFKDGDELHVEYSAGPKPFAARRGNVPLWSGSAGSEAPAAALWLADVWDMWWDGRPSTPPFQWGDSGEVLPPHDQWLRDMNMAAWGLDKLVEPALLLKDPEFLHQDLQATKDVLMQWGGALQAVFTVFQLQGDVTYEQVARMNVTQFRQVMATAKLMSPSYSSDKVDDIFNNMAALCRKQQGPLLGMGEQLAGAASVTFAGFLAGLVHVAYGKAAAAVGSGPNTAQFTQLSSKVETLIRTNLQVNVFPDISKRVERLHPGLTTGSQLLLQKGRRLTEQTLNSCQLKRLRANTVHVDLKHLCLHLVRWRLLNKEFNLPDLAVMVLFAKQQAPHVEDFTLQPHPLWLDYNEFERLLVAMSFWLYQQRKRTKEPVEEFLGAFMDFVYRKSGALQATPGDASNEAASNQTLRP